MAMLVITRGYNFLLSSDLHHDESFKTISILLVQVGRSTTQRLAIFNSASWQIRKRRGQRPRQIFPKREGARKTTDAFVIKMNTRVAWNGETGFRRSSWTCDSSSSSCSRIQWQCFPIQQRSMMINGNKTNNLGNQNQTFFFYPKLSFPWFFLVQSRHSNESTAESYTDTSGRGMDPSRDSQAGLVYSCAVLGKFEQQQPQQR